jgi:hypothetical protein
MVKQSTIPTVGEIKLVFLLQFHGSLPILDQWSLLFQETFLTITYVLSQYQPTFPKLRSSDLKTSGYFMKILPKYYNMDGANLHLRMMMLAS